ncbi:hypothetical protein ACSBR2_031992 [Camellia fascicularis]
MLRNGSRAVTSNKQALMAEHSSLSSPSQNHSKPISSFFSSPRFFNGFLPKPPSETETISPTSILGSNPFSPHNFSGNKHSWEKSDPKGIGLALVGSLNDEKTDSIVSQPNTRKVLFGSKLKIQIPPIPSYPFSPSESPKSPADFGTKTPRNSQFIASLSPFESVNSGTQAKDLNGCLSVSEMELSEDYTCVISHGPNPRTTHIYGNIVVESYCGVVKVSELNSSPEKLNSPPPEHFLSLCYTCKKSLEQGKDIYIYRGEKAFCSSECRCQEMLFNGVESPSESAGDDALL